jgi:hypothetical protein
MAGAGAGFLPTPALSAAAIRRTERTVASMPLAGAKVCDYREHAALVFLCYGQPQLLEDAVHVLLDRALRDRQLTRDAGVRAAFRHQRQHRTLAAAE